MLLVLQWVAFAANIAIVLINQLCLATPDKKKKVNQASNKLKKKKKKVNQPSD